MTIEKSSSKRNHHRMASGACMPEHAGRRLAGAIRPREYGTAEEVTLRAIDEAGGFDTVADFFGLKKPVVQSWTVPELRGDLSLNRALRLTQFRGVTAIVEAMAAAAGGVFMPADAGSHETLIRLLALAQRQNGDFGAVLTAALEDGKIDTTERRQIAQSLSELISTLTKARARLTKGAAQ